ncbi:hypothetical protein [Myxococcus hansupus]|nr:hypothetical protein [Myxococcus hansupus]
MAFFVVPAAHAAIGDRCSPQISHNGVANAVCGGVCAQYGMGFTGNWSNDPNHPPVRSCIDSGGGQAVCGCAITMPSQDSMSIAPAIHHFDAATPLRMPVGLKTTCMQGPDSLNRSAVCPVVMVNGLHFWAHSYNDNRFGMALVAYDSSGNVVGIIERTGARYVWDIALDGANQTVILKGQASQTISVRWRDLIIPQMSGSTTANYVIWPTATSGYASWTNGAANYGYAAPYGTGSNQLLDPYVEHAAGKQLCEEKQKPWFDFVPPTLAAPASTVTCIAPPTPGQSTYNAAMNALLNAAVNNHGLMADLRTATTDALLIQVAARWGYTITNADIAQSRDHSAMASRAVSSEEMAAASTDSASCGGVNQRPCSVCAQEVCVYWPFNFCCIKETCSCERYTSSCAAGLHLDGNGLCQEPCPSGLATDSAGSCPTTCPANQICKDFRVFVEYNDNGTKSNGVCESWLPRSDCAKGIPSTALAAYEVIFKDGRAYYKSTNTLVQTWSGNSQREMLYVIDARDNKIYMVNVEGRFIQVRGTANCVGDTRPSGASTGDCNKPRLTTHAGILMGSFAGLPTPNSQPGETVMQKINVIGAGTIQVNNGEIQWITNDSGHFTPSQQNLMNSIAHIKTAGFPNFPPRGDCAYDLKPVPGKTGVYRQDALTGSHCEL